MADLRRLSRPIMFAAGCWLFLTAACDRRAAVPAAEPGQRPHPTTVGDMRSLTHALKPRMSPPPGGLRAEKDSRGNTIIRSKGLLQNVMVAGRGPDGRVITGCLSSPEQVQGLLGGVASTGR